MRVQSGLMPTDFKPMVAVGPGAYEIRVHHGGAWRVIYAARFGDVVYVLHAFRKNPNRPRVRILNWRQSGTN
ncbi:MAG: type II toxin-antitoxin system RelE/ParE family toxin [Nevskiales bacterium]